MKIKIEVEDNGQELMVSGTDWAKLDILVRSFLGLTPLTATTQLPPPAETAPTETKKAPAARVKHEKPAETKVEETKPVEEKPKAVEKAKAKETEDDAGTPAELAEAHADTKPSEKPASTGGREITDGLKAAQKIRDVVDGFMSMGVETAAEMIVLGEKWKKQIPALANVSNVKERIERACEVLGI